MAIPRKGSQMARLWQACFDNPGLTACQYTKMLFPKSKCSKPCSVITTLQRLVKAGLLKRRKKKGQKTVKAWRFYPTICDDHYSALVEKAGQM